MEKQVIRRRIVKVGNSYGLIFDKTIMDIFGFKEDDILDISDLVKILPNEKSSKKMLKQIKDEVDPIGTRSRK